jgi:hypothetical protein
VNPLARLLGLWRGYQRATDIKILWPACKENAPDLETARMAFTVHAALDPAWTSLGPEEMRRQIEELK